MVLTRVEDVDMAAASPWVDTCTADTVLVTSIGGGTPVIVVTDVVPGRAVPRAILPGSGGAVVNILARDSLIPLTPSARLFSLS